MRRELNQLRETFTHDSIALLVSRFYARVRSDPGLGPVFAARIQEWPPHLEQMNRFWATILRAEPGYSSIKGTPQQIHQSIPELTPQHFERWLSLFEETATEIFSSWGVQQLLLRARRMAVTLSGHLPPETKVPGESIRHER